MNNSVFSPYFEDVKFFRKEFVNIRKLAKTDRKNNYAYCFLSLLTNAVCENVDTENRTRMKNKPNVYINMSMLKRMLCTKTIKEAKSILEVLEKNFGAIEYKIINRLVYIHFNICNSHIIKGDYSRNNDDAFTTEMAIKNNEGFIMPNKAELFNTFYKDYKEHGSADTYIFLRLNAAHNSNNLDDYIPAFAKSSYLALWKVDCSYDEETVEYSLYCRQKAIAEFLGMNIKRLQRYFHRFVSLELVEKIVLNKRGIVIIFNELEKICSNYECSNKIIKITNTIRKGECLENFYYRIKEFISSMKEKYSLVSKSFWFLNTVHYKGTKLFICEEDYDEIDLPFIA